MTPEIERVRRNQEQLSAVKYKGELKQPTSISDLPELKRVKENQKNISNVGTSQYLSFVFNVIKCVNMQMRELY